MTKVHWLLAGILWVLISTQACAPVAPGQKVEIGPQDLPTAKRLNEEAQHLLHGGEELLYRNGTPFHCDAAGFDAGDVQQVVDEVRQQIRVLFHPRDPITLGLHE